MKARFAVLQMIGAAVLAAFAVAGFLDNAVAGPARFWVAAITLSAIFGLASLVRGADRHAFFAREWLTALALAGTVHGMILALGALNGLTAGNDGAVAELAVGVSLAMWSTLSGLIGTLWLALTIHVCRP